MTFHITSPITVVGLTGRKRSGKDRLGSMLVKHQDFYRLAYADKLYQELATAFSVPVSYLQEEATKESILLPLSVGNCRDDAFREYCLQSLELSPAVCFSPRHLLQTFGTDFRQIHQGQVDYYRDEVRAELKRAYGKGYRRFVITDVRFEPDIPQVEQEFDGTVIRVLRPGLPRLIDRHTSETALDSYVFHTVTNEENAPAETLLEQCLDIIG